MCIDVLSVYMIYKKFKKLGLKQNNYEHFHGINISEHGKNAHMC
jgi:hypothetical protein